MKVSKLKPNPTNPRLIKDERFAKLVKSIQEFPKGMELRPIVVDDDMMILGGNMRLKAIQHLGMKDIPDEWVKKASDLTEEERNRFIIMDNVGFGEWDWDVIANEWDVEQVKEWGLEVPDFGKESSEDDFVMPDEIQTDIVSGDLFEIGSHRLLCGDSTDSDNVLSLLNGQQADLLTDPPYGIDINMNMGRRKGQPEKFDNKDWDKSIPDFFGLLPFFNKQIIWGGNYFADKLTPTKDWLCWYKKTKGLDFAEFELAWTNCGMNGRLLEHHWSGEKKLHPTMKPVPVMAWCFDYLDGDVVFDLLLGSGTTMVAAHQLNRKCYGIEISPQYCQVIIDRMRKLNPELVIKLNGELFT